MVASIQAKLQQELGCSTEDASFELNAALRLSEYEFRGLGVDKEIVELVAYYMVKHSFELKQISSNINVDKEVTKRSIGSASEEYTIEHRKTSSSSTEDNGSLGFTISGQEVLKIKKAIANQQKVKTSMATISAVGDFFIEDEGY